MPLTARYKKELEIMAKINTLLGDDKWSHDSNPMNERDQAEYNRLQEELIRIRDRD